MIFLNQYYEDEGLDSGSGWSKQKPPKYTKEIVASTLQDDYFLFRANEHGDLVGVEEENSTHQSEYDDECKIFESTTFQKSKKSKPSSASYEECHQGDYKKSGLSLASRSEKPGIFDRKALSRDISANLDKRVSNRPVRVPTKDYVIDIPVTSHPQKDKAGFQDCSDEFESDANQQNQVDVDLSGDSDLYTEVQNYMKGHKHAGGLRAKDQTGTVMNNIPTKMLMSCVDDEHSKSRTKGGIFNTHSYDRATSKQSLLNAKTELDRLKSFSKAATAATKEDPKLIRGRTAASIPPARENSKEPVPPSSVHPKLSIVTNVFSVVIAPRNLPKQHLTLPADCPHCGRAITSTVASKPSASNGRTHSKHSLKAGGHPSAHVGGKSRPLTPKPQVATEAARPESHKLDRSLLNKTIMRTDTSKENHVTDRRKSAFGRRSCERLALQPTAALAKSGNGLQRRVLQDRERNRLGVDEFSKSPIMRTLNDSKDSRGTFDDRSSWSRVERPLQKSKDTLRLTPELSRPKKPAVSGVHVKTGTQGLASKKQNMKFR